MRGFHTHHTLKGGSCPVGNPACTGPSTKEESPLRQGQHVRGLRLGVTTPFRVWAPLSAKVEYGPTDANPACAPLSAKGDSCRGGIIPPFVLEGAHAGFASVGAHPPFALKGAHSISVSLWMNVPTK